jgi:8-oxo-dGTP diphosphatase
MRQLPTDRPLVTVDLVILSEQRGDLHALLVRRPSTPGEPYPGQWALPGGFVDVALDEDLEACARRKLFEKTGVVSPYLEQLGGFGSRSRDPRGWSVTQVYFALVCADAVVLRAGANAEEVRWWPVYEAGVPPNLAFDHDYLVDAAMDRLVAKAEYTSLPAFLLPGEFTLPDLQRVYEVVLRRPIEKSAFRKRVITAGLVVELPRQRDTGKRPAQLYRLANREAPVFFPRTFSPRES